MAALFAATDQACLTALQCTERVSRTFETTVSEATEKICKQSNVLMAGLDKIIKRESGLVLHESHKWQLIGIFHGVCVLLGCIFIAYNTFIGRSIQQFMTILSHLWTDEVTFRPGDLVIFVCELCCWLSICYLVYFFIRRSQDDHDSIQLLKLRELIRAELGQIETHVGFHPHHAWELTTENCPLQPLVKTSADKYPLRTAIEEQIHVKVNSDVAIFISAHGHGGGGTDGTTYIVPIIRTPSTNDHPSELVDFERCTKATGPRLGRFPLPFPGAAYAINNQQWTDLHSQAVYRVPPGQYHVEALVGLVVGSEIVGINMIVVVIPRPDRAKPVPLGIPPPQA